MIYMAVNDTTTIRVSARTRDRLKILAARRGEPAGEVVAKLVNAADEEAMLAEIATGFEKLAQNPAALAAYRALVAELRAKTSAEIESAFDASTPEW